MTFLPSPSKYALADACGYPWSPHAPRWPKLSDSQYSGFGRAISQAAECLAVWGAAPLEAIATANACDLGQLSRCAHRIADQLDDDGATWRWAECPIVFDASTGEARIQPGARRSVADLVQIAGGELVVRDYKSGRNQARDLDVRTDPQLRAYGLFAARALGFDAVRVEIAHVTDDAIVVDPDTLGPFELEVAEAEVRERLARPYHLAVPQPGRHCAARYCPIVSECPATRLQLAAIATASTGPELPLTVEVRSLEHAVSIRARTKAVRAACDAFDAAARAYVQAHGPVELEPGLWWGNVQHDGVESIDASRPEARAALERHLGAFGVTTALSYETTKSAIHRAAVQAAPRGKAAALERALYTELREVGALRRGPPYARVEEFRRREAGDAEREPASTGVANNEGT